MSLNRAPERSCAYGCGTKTRRSSGICARCFPTEPAVTHPSPTDELAGGRWVTVRGIQRWLSVEEEIDQYAARSEARDELLAALLVEISLPSAWWSRASAKAHRAKRRRQLAEDYERGARSA